MGFRTTSLALLLAIGASPVIAQEALPSGLTLKLGVTPVVGSAGMQGARGGALFGAEYALDLKTCALFVGLDYRLFSDTQRERTRFGVGYYVDSNSPSGVSVGQITVQGPDGYSDVLLDSADLRTNKLEGLTLNFGYRHYLTSNIRIHGGLNLAFLRSVQYVTGVINVVDDRETATSPMGSESMNFDVHATKASLGAFVGARYLINEYMFGEINVSNIGYKEVNYMPFAYTGKAAFNEATNRRKTTVEFNLGIIF